jgi:hypothetical protein
LTLVIIYYFIDYKKLKGKNLGLKSHISISIKNNVTDKSHKKKLIKFPNNSGRFWLRFDGVNSTKTPEATLIQLCNRLKKLLKIMVREI